MIEEPARCLDDAHVGKTLAEDADEFLFAGNAEAEPKDVGGQPVDFVQLGEQFGSREVAMTASDDGQARVACRTAAAARSFSSSVAPKM